MSKVNNQKSGIGVSTIKWASVIISVFLMALGVCTFIWPEITAGTICSAIGAAAIVFGIIMILTYFMREIRGVALNYDFSIGALAVVAGIVLLISRDKVVDLLQVMLGAYLIFDSVFKLQTAIDAKRLGVSGWWVSLFLTIICTALGVVLITDIGSNLLMIIIGVSLIADGLQNLCLVIFSAVAARALAHLDKNANGILDAAAPTHPEPPVHAAPTPAPVAEAPAAGTAAVPQTQAQSPETPAAEPHAETESAADPDWFNLPPV